MYDLAAHGDMIADRGRTAAYARALERHVRAGSVVLDLGTGTGIMALMACRLGAARVYAVDPDPVIQIAREAAAANGLADRITCIEGVADDLDLPEPVDGIVADVHGCLPWFGTGLKSLLEARARWLKPGGWIVPGRETVWAALVSSEPIYGRLVDRWTAVNGFDLGAARSRAVNDWRRERFAESEVMVEPVCWKTLDYTRLSDLQAQGQLTWAIDRPFTCHGLSVWFDAEAGNEPMFSNAPGGEPHVYGQAFFPWPDATVLACEDRISISLRADWTGADYVWSWESDVARRSGSPMRYTQSSWLAAPLSRGQLRRRAHDFVPGGTTDARIDRLILDLMEQGLSLGDIASALCQAFPGSFDSWDRALSRAGMLAERYPGPSRG